MRVRALGSSIAPKETRKEMSQQYPFPITETLRPENTFIHLGDIEVLDVEVEVEVAVYLVVEL